MNNKRLFQTLINTGVDSEENETTIKIQAMNKIMLFALIISITVLITGIAIQYIGYIIVGLFLFTIISTGLFFTYKKMYRFSWHLLLTSFIQVLVFLPFFTQSSPTLIIYFISFQSLVLAFFKDKKIIYSYFIYYSVSAILFNYFLFELNPHHINYNSGINIFSLMIGLVVTFYSLQFYISSKQKSEAILTVEEAKFKVLFENSPLGILVSDIDDFTKKMVNNAFTEILGYTKEELGKKTIDEITHIEDKELHKPFIDNLMRGEIDSFELEKRYIHKNGKVIWGRVVISLIKNTDGTPLYHVANFLNISEQKEQEQKIFELIKELKGVNVQLEQKINQRTEDLTTANEELLRSNQDLEQFAYAASHDLKEPLRMISSFVQILNRKYSDKLDDKGKEYIHYTIDGVQRMSDLISSLLQYSRVGRKESKVRPSKVSNLIEIKLMDLRQLITDKNATVDLLELPEQIICEPIQIGLVFYNLINNSLKFNEKETPNIKIKGTERENDYLFSIQDNGIGIEDRFKEQVFEIFKRLHVREKYEGTGIGLALCKKIIYRHNGEIWFDSELGKGTTFYFTIGKNLK